MKYISLGLAVVSLLAGLVSAWYWLQSSKVKIDPCWIVEPGEFEASQMGWTVALLTASLEAAKLNKVAAILAGVSIAAGSLASFIGVAG